MGAAIIGIGPAVGPAASASSCLNWTGTQPPNPGAASSGSSIWAVGFSSTGAARQALAFHCC
jgi:hypothetical protein